MVIKDKLDTIKYGITVAAAAVVMAGLGYAIALPSKKEREEPHIFAHIIATAQETAEFMAEEIETRALYDIDHNGRTYTVALTSAGQNSLFLRTERGYERADLSEEEESGLLSKLPK